MIGDVIKRYREQNGWTQEELAERMGYTSKSTINKIEKNINDVKQRNIIKFAEVFGCDVTDLICSEPTDMVIEPIKETPIESKYTPEQIERAMKFIEQFDHQIPAIQDAIVNLLKSNQSDS